MSDRYFYERECDLVVGNRHEVFDQEDELADETDFLCDGYLVFDSTVGRGGDSSGKDGYVAFCLDRRDAERIVAALNAIPPKPPVLCWPVTPTSSTYSTDLFG